MQFQLPVLERFDKKIPERESWNTQSGNELLMHKIHLYPAKFPSFLISKALEYADERKIKVKAIGDIFCGCGTTALEARMNEKEFWGCDINPVATLIAKTKREQYDIAKLDKYFCGILEWYATHSPIVPNRIRANERILYWFTNQQIKELHRLLTAIKKTIPNGKYRNFFLVAFSNILKRTSRWLIKSIKPQRDPNKDYPDVISTFTSQYKFMYNAVVELGIDDVSTRKKSTIVNRNFLNLKIRKPFLDMLITSPPYVTSYEYADLHQLSTLWLGYAEDYKSLRKGTIGSVVHDAIKQRDLDGLDSFALKTYDSLVKRKARNPKSALKYFVDMKKTIDKSFGLIKGGGLAVFVIGNTTYKNVYVDNARYLTNCILSKGFVSVEVLKRKISAKILTPYRDSEGRFSTNKKHRKVYNYEFIIIARKPVTKKKSSSSAL